MALLAARQSLELDFPFPSVDFPAGDNSSDTIIHGVHLNLTTLQHWSYNLFENNTISNRSWCLLAFPPYVPAGVLENGTWVNVTWCWTPAKPIGHRAGIAIGVAVLFAIALAMTLVNLHKHGKMYLPAQKRFAPIGRRWQWYWAIFTCATAMISLLTSIDVDRYYLPELPILLTSFFWYLMQMSAVAIVWEAVRHWGSWMERQFIDPDPFSLRIDDRRSQVEFWLPLWFYLWWWLHFFLIVPRNWEPIQHQRYPQQTILDAIPIATDGRFKAAAFCLLVAWLTICFSLRHSIRHYCERNRGIFNRLVGFFRFMPTRFMFIIPLSLVVIAFQELVAWKFAYSPLNVTGHNGAIFAGGYLPSLLIVVIQALFGFITPNEDKELLSQRRQRNRALDQEMGLTHKPSWWRRLNGEHAPANERMQDRIARNVREVNGRKAKPENTVQATAGEVGNAPVDGDLMEMGPVSPRRQPEEIFGPIVPVPKPATDALQIKSEALRKERAMQTAASLLFPNSGEAAAAAAARRAELMMDGPPPPLVPPPPYMSESERRGRMASDAASSTLSSPVQRSVSVNTATTRGSTSGPPQQIKSMLDI